MKLFLLACLVAVVAAAPQLRRPFFSSRPAPRPFRPAPPPPQPARVTPQFRGADRHIAIISDNRQDNGDGSFSYNFETEDGTIVNAVGTPGSKGQSNIQGSYRFILDDGTVAEFHYVADENGYRAESPLIPTPHPLPAHAIEQIRFAEQERAQGGFRPNRRF